MKQNLWKRTNLYVFVTTISYQINLVPFGMIQLLEPIILSGGENWFEILHRQETEVAKRKEKRKKIFSVVKVGNHVLRHEEH